MCLSGSSSRGGSWVLQTGTTRLKSTKIQLVKQNLHSYLNLCNNIFSIFLLIYYTKLGVSSGSVADLRGCDSETVEMLVDVDSCCGLFGVGCIYGQLVTLGYKVPY